MLRTFLLSLRCVIADLSETFCDLPYDSGPCRGSGERYFYEKEMHKCSMFLYGGCGGNKNNFKKMIDCLQACQPIPKKKCKWLTLIHVFYKRSYLVILSFDRCVIDIWTQSAS